MFKLIHLLMVILLALGVNAKAKSFDLLELDGATVLGDSNSTELQSYQPDDQLLRQGFFDWLIDYLWYDEDEEEETYLICRNCTVVIGQNNTVSPTVATPTMAPASSSTPTMVPASSSAPTMAPGQGEG